MSLALKYRHPFPVLCNMVEAMCAQGRGSRGPVPESCDGVGWQQSQAMIRRGRRVLEVLLSFGGCSQIHCNLLLHVELSVFLLDNSLQSAG